MRWPTTGCGRVSRKALLPPVCPQPSPALMRKLGLPIGPIVLSYETIAKNDSLYNTLSIFDLYVAGLVLKKLLATYPDKIDGQETVANKKAQLIYNVRRPPSSPPPANFDPCHCCMLAASTCWRVLIYADL